MSIATNLLTGGRRSIAAIVPLSSGMLSSRCAVCCQPVMHNEWSVCGCWSSSTDVMRRRRCENQLGVGLQHTTHYEIVSQKPWPRHKGHLFSIRQLDNNVRDSVSARMQGRINC